MAKEEAKDEGGEQPIIIKNIKKGGGHHGGAWKVAYADFVTAMMAFFLLLWLLNVSTDEQLNAISNYFDPTHPKIAETRSGSDGLMGGLSVSTEGAMVTQVQPLTQPTPTGQAGDRAKSAEDAARKKAAAEEEKRFEDAQKELEQKIMEVPELAAMAENLLVDMTPEGLRIQMVDSEGKSMFESGSAKLKQEAQLLLGMISEIIKPLPNDLSIRGHTDSSGYGPGADYTNWELSADRANASRKALELFAFPPERINNVVGKADREPLKKDDPYHPSNRRISIILLKDEIVNPPEESEEGETGEVVGEGQEGGTEGALPGPSQPPPIGTFRKTPGAVEFP